jgi:hypothetical protein
MEIRMAVKKSAKSNPYKPTGKHRGSGIGGAEARKKKMIQALKTNGGPGREQKRRRFKR